MDAEIRRAAKKSKGELTKADYEKVDSLDLSNCGTRKGDRWAIVTSLKGLEKCTNITYLEVTCNELTSVKELEKCTKLTYLVLANNKLTDVKGLEKCTELVSLNLNQNELTDVKGLEKLTKLERLHLSSNPGLTKAKVDELLNALPKCDISSDYGRRRPEIR